ncbi:hypothetical protein DH09_01740 [Bacillaceae bacterium JMAK1]|nr:hypothetical protein DH09_01740 [Bacillaceae bacterium JMAK1]
MPKKKKNGVWNTINHYLFGNDTKENDDETVEPKRQDRASYGRQDKRNDDASRAKVFHKYPKEGNFRFPLDVDEGKKQDTPKRTEPLRPTKKKSESQPIKSEKVEEKPKRQSRQSVKQSTSKTPPPTLNERRQYFNNPHFSVQNIPSPVHGFQKSKNLQVDEDESAEVMPTADLSKDSTHNNDLQALYRRVNKEALERLQSEKRRIESDEQLQLEDEVAATNLAERVSDGVRDHVQDNGHDNENVEREHQATFTTRDSELSDSAYRSVTQGDDEQTEDYELIEREEFEITDEKADALRDSERPDSAFIQEERAQELYNETEEQADNHIVESTAKEKKIESNSDGFNFPRNSQRKENELPNEADDQGDHLSETVVQEEAGADVTSTLSDRERTDVALIQEEDQQDEGKGLFDEIKEQDDHFVELDVQEDEAKVQDEAAIESINSDSDEFVNRFGEVRDVDEEMPNEASKQSHLPDESKEVEVERPESVAAIKEDADIQVPHETEVVSSKQEVREIDGNDSEETLVFEDDEQGQQFEESMFIEKEHQISSDSSSEQHAQLIEENTVPEQSYEVEERLEADQDQDATSLLPYNVMMTPSDRAAYLRKKKKESEGTKESSRETFSSQATPSITEDQKNDDEAKPLFSEEPKEEEANPSTSSELVDTKPVSPPPYDLLVEPVVNETEGASEQLIRQKEQLEATLQHFHVDAKVTDVTEGPSVTRFEVQPAPGVKVTKVTNLTDDLKLAMAAIDLRMEAPIPGKSAIGIEVPKLNRNPVVLREILESKAFLEHESPLAVALGLDISGEPTVIDLKKMPHGLIAGSTGSGKSVCINSILLSLLYKATPEEVKLLLIDPKVVELAFYQDIPHLAAPVVTDPKEATMTLKWSVEEMERRYQLFAKAGVRDISGYNRKAERKDKLPYLVIVIDELADLMMVSPQDVEEYICRIAQKARACGIHLLVATQRPSVDVITGLIKANIPTRTAFAVSSMADSRTILDAGGAERLIGKGDMLFSENGASRFVRLQGTFVDDEEIERVADYWKARQKPNYLFTKDEITKQSTMNVVEDDLLEEVTYFVVRQGSASTSSIQRRFHIGYNRAARLMDMLEERGIVSEALGTKPRQVLVSEEVVHALFE